MTKSVKRTAENDLGRATVDFLSLTFSAPSIHRLRNEY
jgi:hypothetical protein